MLAVLALGTVEALFNQWIDLDAATRQQMNTLQGKLLRVVLDSPQLSVDVLFDQDKIRLSPTVLDAPAQKTSIFEQRPYDAAHAPQPANTTLHVANLVALGKLMTASAGETGNIPLQGEMGVLQQLQRILAQAEPDLASRLSPWIGAIPARQIGDVIAHGKKAVQQVSSSVVMHTEEMVSEDSQLFVARWQMDQFKQQVRALRLDVERAQAKVQFLQQQVEVKMNQNLPIQNVLPEHEQAQQQQQ